MTAWKPVKGKCLICGRVRADAKPVLRHKENHGQHYLHCTQCDSEFSADTKQDVMRQRG